MAAITTSYDVTSGDESTLAVNITPTQTSGIKIAPMSINGEDVALAATSGVLQIEQEIDGTRKVEWLAFNGRSVNSDNSITLTSDSVSRDVARDGSTLTGSGTGQRFNKGAKVKLVTFHFLLNQKADVDRANTFTAHQTIAESVELRFDDSGTAIYDDGTDLYFKDSNQGAVSLSTLAAANGTDEKIKISANDTTSGYLSAKLTGGDGITVTEVNDAGEETLDIDVELATDPGLEFSSGGLRAKIDSTGITRTSSGLGLPTPGAAGQVLTSSGTAWASGKLLSINGNASDGTPDWSAGASLSPATVKNYLSATVPSGQTVTVSSTNVPLIINTLGDVTINGTVDLDGKGGAGGAAKTTTGAGNAGTAGDSAVSASLLRTNAGSGGGQSTTAAAGGGGGGTWLTAGTAGTTSGGATGGSAGAASITTDTQLHDVSLLRNLFRAVACGGGGGGGAKGSTANGDGGAGGNGGGALVWLIGGNLTLGASSVIRARGAAGSAGTSNSGESGGGGGGGGGMIFILVAGTITNGGLTLQVSGGAGGNGGTVGGAGGAGAAGKAVIYSLSDGTLITS